MGEVFEPTYASYYDQIYEEKDYAGECDLIEATLAEHEIPLPARILDLGCGTGGHALPLAQRGHAVTGIDRSDSMLAIARQKAARLGVKLSLEAGDVRSTRQRGEFDAVICMFAVLGYQLSNTDVTATLQTARHHLRPGGLFMCDFWYGPSVLSIKPEQRIKIIERGGIRLIRLAIPKLDTRRHANQTDYRLLATRDGVILRETCEQHVVRYFFPLELELFLTAAGLQLHKITSFPNIDAEPSEDNWNAFAVARAV